MKVILAGKLSRQKKKIKMATGRSSASELIDSLVNEPFTKVVCLFDWRKGLSVEVFRKTQQVLDRYATLHYSW